MANAPARLAAALADRYRLERPLGEGGMATVYLAEDLKHDRQVAVKVLKPELAAVLGAERFVVEIKTTAALQHPHILPLFDSGEADGFLYYVMPYVDGETLRAKLDRETQLGVDEAVRLTTAVADALDCAHRRGVIHRDIKPENILLQDGRPVVADFGIALAVSAAAGGRMTETGLSLGTPHYMSPEQATAEKEISARSDQYALASVLYEMLAGNPPHTGASAQQIIMRIITEPAAPVTSVRRNVPANVEAALSLALEKLPADRFESTKAFAEALNNPAFRAAGAPVAAASNAAATRGVPWPAFAVVAIGLAAVAAWGWLGRGATAGSTDSVVLTLAQSGPLGARATEIESVPVSISPDGRTLAYVVAPEGVPMLAVRALDALEPTIVPGTENLDGGMTFSPDGRSIAFVQRRTLRRVALDGTPPVDIASLDRLQSIFSMSWPDDGTIYYSPDGTRAFYRVAADGTSDPIAMPYPDSTTFHYGLHPVPGTSWLLTSMLSRTGVQTPMALSTTNGGHRRLDINASSVLPLADGRAVLLSKPNQTLTIAPFDPETLTLTGPEVVVLSKMGGNPYVRGANVVLSAAGALAYRAESLDPTQLVEVSRAGRERPLTSDRATYEFPRWSPDGTRMAFGIREGALRGGLWVEELRTGTRTRLSSGSWDSKPVWTPDGRALYFASPRPGAAGIWRIPADGSGDPTPVATRDTADLAQFGTFTSDGRTLLYRLLEPETGRDIVAAPLDRPRDVRPLFTTQTEETGPAFSPDDRWLAWESTESGRNEVYVTAWPALGARVQISSGGGGEPAWNPRGGELFYRTGNALVSVTLDERGVLPRVVRRDTLFTGPYRGEDEMRQYDVSADGERFLMVRGETRPQPLVVITNWLAGAMERMRGASSP